MMNARMDCGMLHSSWVSSHGQELQECLLCVRILLNEYRKLHELKQQ